MNKHMMKLQVKKELQQQAARDARETELKKIQAAAVDGSVRLHVDDDELVELVRYGHVSESDAMNQDF